MAHAAAVAGDGSRRAALAYRAARLPVRFAGHINDRSAVAALLASADVVVAPGPVETFGLAALEALACGTPEAFAEGVRRLMARPEGERRAAARARAELFGWPQAVDGFLRAHGALPPGRSSAVLARQTVPARALRPAVPAVAAVASSAWATAPGDAL